MWATPFAPPPLSTTPTLGRPASPTGMCRSRRATAPASAPSVRAAHTRAPPETAPACTGTAPGPKQKRANRDTTHPARISSIRSIVSKNRPPAPLEHGIRYASGRRLYKGSIFHAAPCTPFPFFTVPHRFCPANGMAAVGAACIFRAVESVFSDRLRMFAGNHYRIDVCKPTPKTRTTC